MIVLVELDLSGVDVDAQRRRLEKELVAAEKELTSTTGRLGNDAFLTRAPAAVVEKISQRQRVARAEVERLTTRLEGMEI